LLLTGELLGFQKWFWHVLGPLPDIHMDKLKTIRTLSYDK